MIDLEYLRLVREVQAILIDCEAIELRVWHSFG
jgi:hypothetical protein